MVGTTKGDLFRSVKGGTDFALIYDSPGSSQGQGYSVVSINGGSGQNLFSALIHNLNLWNQSTDILGSPDLGTTFSLRSEGLMTGFRSEATLTSVDFSGDSHGLLVGADLLVTKVRGKSFKSVLSESLHSSGTLTEGKEQMT